MIEDYHIQWHGTVLCYCEETENSLVYFWCYGAK